MYEADVIWWQERFNIIGDTIDRINNYTSHPDDMPPYDVRARNFFEHGKVPASISEDDDDDDDSNNSYW